MTGDLTSSGTGAPAVLIERRGGVLTITMNRPQSLNVLDEAMADALLDAFSNIGDDASVRAVVLCGAGRSFMAGGDLTRFKADLHKAPHTAAALIDRFHALLRIIKTMPQPVIAAVQGPVAGGGLGLAFCCDLVVAADDATFLSAYTKLGTSPDGGTTWSLTQSMGTRRALEFILFNKPIDAGTAHRLGLVNEVVPASGLQATAAAWADQVCGFASGATGASKALVQAAVRSSFAEQMDQERQHFVAAAATEDFREGITAFFGRRPPKFS